MKSKCDTSQALVIKKWLDQLEPLIADEYTPKLSAATRSRIINESSFSPGVCATTIRSELHVELYFDRHTYFVRNRDFTGKAYHILNKDCIFS